MVEPSDKIRIWINQIHEIVNNINYGYFINLVLDERNGNLINKKKK